MKGLKIELDFIIRVINCFKTQLALIERFEYAKIVFDF